METPCRGWEAARLVVELAVTQCLGWEAAGVVVGPVETPCRNFQAAGASDDIEQAWA